MRPHGLVLCALALLALCSCASAGRLVPNSVEDFVMRSISFGDRAPHAPAHPPADLTAILDAGHGPWGGPIHVLARFFVRPTIHREFVEEFRRFSEGIERSKAKIRVRLSKPIGDNIKFGAYMVAKDGAEFHKIFEQESFRDFMHFLHDRDIAVVHSRLIPQGFVGMRSNSWEAPNDDASAALELRQQQREQLGCPAKSLKELAEETAAAAVDDRDEAVAAAAAVEEGSGWGEEQAFVAESGKQPQGHPLVFRIGTLFEVPPGHGRKFVKAWIKLACEVEGWKGTRAFALSSVMGDNTHYIGYAAWERPEKPPSKKHMEEIRRAFKRWKEEVEDLGVALHSSPMISLSPPPCHRA